MTRGDGAGWHVCMLCRATHWGRYGAAGLALVRGIGDAPEVLVARRAAGTDAAGTWGLPGGARDSHETPEQAAVREAHEELDLDPAGYRVTGLRVVDDHGRWTYWTVLAAADPTTAPAPAAECDSLAWLPAATPEALPLHPRLRTGWPWLAAAIDRAAGRVAASDDGDGMV